MSILNNITHIYRCEAYVSFMYNKARFCMTSSKLTDIITHVYVKSNCNNPHINVWHILVLCMIKQYLI